VRSAGGGAGTTGLEGVCDDGVVAGSIVFPGHFRSHGVWHTIQLQLTHRRLRESHPTRERNKGGKLGREEEMLQDSDA
jgi:hypothetical protein